MTTVYAIENQKGGCGKTTTSIQIADYAAHVANKKTLVIDVDPSGNLTKTFLGTEVVKRDLFTFLMNRPKSTEGIDAFQKVDENLYMLGSTKQLNGINMQSDFDAPLMLREALEPFKWLFDVIIIDGCPEITQLTHNLFAAADKVIVPMNPGSYSVMGLADLQNEISFVRKMYNPNLKIHGLLLSNIDKNTKAEQAINEMAKTCCDLLDTKVFDNTVYHTTVINDAQIAGIPIRKYKKSHKVNMVYTELCNEIFKEEGWK
ncbi:chromosome partitioning protein [Breznakia blatticola]|uniref:Chromosome partitioning protein n=1 Tax=Breznakia blatticola TaxID=1754012 RepID=A0A4V3G7Q2_9FIRM|nr:ParA family protein [Breznakia blatticola]TDW19944.1 chromosome partitioning protein [Breznakia blatticola]